MGPSVTLHIKHFIESFQFVQAFTNQETDPLFVIAVSINFNLLSNSVPQFTSSGRGSSSGNSQSLPVKLEDSSANKEILQIHGEICFLATAWRLLLLLRDDDDDE